jgi:hypothetical protein
MTLRSGKRFSPYDIDVSSLPPTEVLATALDFSPLLQAAVTLEDARAIDEEDDSEGAVLSSEALEDELSDLTPLEDSGSESSDDDQTSIGPSSSRVETAPPGQVEKFRKKAYDKARRKKSRKAKATDSTQRLPGVNATLSRKYPRPISTTTSFNASALPHARGAYVGRRLLNPHHTPWQLAKLLDKGYALVRWDGR